MFYDLERNHFLNKILGLSPKWDYKPTFKNVSQSKRNRTTKKKIQ